MTYTDKKKSSFFETPSGLKYSGFFRFFGGGGVINSLYYALINIMYELVHNNKALVSHGYVCDLRSLLYDCRLRGGGGEPRGLGHQLSKNSKQVQH